MSDKHRKLHCIDDYNLFIISQRLCKTVITQVPANELKLESTTHNKQDQFPHISQLNPITQLLPTRKQTNNSIFKLLLMQHHTLQRNPVYLLLHASVQGYPLLVSVSLMDRGQKIHHSSHTNSTASSALWVFNGCLWHCQDSNSQCHAEKVHVVVPPRSQNSNSALSYIELLLWLEVNSVNFTISKGTI